MEQTKKGISIPIFIIVIIIFLIIGLVGGLFVSKEYIYKEDNKTTKKTTNETTKLVEEEKYEFEKYTIKEIESIEYTDSSFNVVEKQLNEIFNIKIEMDKENVDLDIYVNNKKIDGYFWLESEMAIIDDLLLFSTNGTDVRSTDLHIIDKEGQEIETITILDSNDSNMVLNEPPTINNDYILLKGTTISHGPSIANEIDLCDKEEMEKASITGDTIVSAEYKMVYKGNHNFTTELISNKKLSEEIDLDSVCG